MIISYVINTVINTTYTINTVINTLCMINAVMNTLCMIKYIIVCVWNVIINLERYLSHMTKYNKFILCNVSFQVFDLFILDKSWNVLSNDSSFLITHKTHWIMFYSFLISHEIH